jgi:hypothetical protein
MSLRGVVENLVATPSSQDRAFCSDTPGAAETISEPTDAKPLDAAHSAAAAGELLALLTSADAIALLYRPPLGSCPKATENGSRLCSSD